MRRLVIILGSLGATLVLAWLLLPPSRREARQASEHEVPRSAEAPSEPKVAEQSSQRSVQQAEATAVKRYVDEKLRDQAYDWKQPIAFYGEAVDENGQPVADAKVHLEWNNLSIKGTAEVDTRCGPDGRFSITGIRGKRLYVDVMKAGYYSSHADRIAFEYANPADGLFTPDPSKPIMFHLRKKGEGAELTRSRSGSSDTLPIHVPRDGTAVLLDVRSGKIGDAGQIRLSEHKPDDKDWKRAESWSFAIEIPDGGLVTQNDEFPFTPPEDGYLPKLEFNFDRQEPGWSTDIKTNFYIKFGNPPVYGWLRLETSVAYGGALIAYAINPSGARNLEPK